MTHPAFYVNIFDAVRTELAQEVPKGRREASGSMTVGIRHDDLRRRNRALVIGAVRRASQPSRTDIARVTGLSHSTISAISGDLLAEGVLTEVRSGETALKRGRPQIGIGLNPGAASIITVVLSLNSLAAALIDYAGNVVAEDHRRLATLSASRDELMAQTGAMVQRLLARPERPKRKVMRIVMAVQGITDSAARAMLWSPITADSDIPFADALEAACGIPVTVENDCSMIAMALRWRDPERYRDDFVAILLSHGIGMGLMLKGVLFSGTHSSGAEFGHMIHQPEGALCRCGRRGCVEAYAGNYAIWRNAHGHDDSEPPAADIGEEEIVALAEAARERDGEERRAFEKAGRALGYGLGNLFALIDPAPVAFVGQGALAFDLIEPALRRAIAQTAGGQHSDAISFATEPNEMPLIREGCAMHALTFLDQEIFAPGAAVPQKVSARVMA
jgi:predicted NBD/HSP70 family sugar kinase